MRDCWLFLPDDNDVVDADHDHDHEYDVDDHDYDCTPEPWFSLVCHWSSVKFRTLYLTYIGIFYKYYTNSKWFTMLRKYDIKQKTKWHSKTNIYYCAYHLQSIGIFICFVLRQGSSIVLEPVLEVDLIDKAGF